MLWEMQALDHFLIFPQVARITTYNERTVIWLDPVSQIRMFQLQLMKDVKFLPT